MSPDHPYHVTARCINREWFRIPLEEVWAITNDYLWVTIREFNLLVYGFVLMPNHWHLIATSPDCNLGPALNYFMRETSREITPLSGRMPEDTLLFEPGLSVQNLEWLNRKPKKLNDDAIRKGLRRRTFQLPKDKNGKPCELETLLL